VPDERISRREILRRGAAFGVSISTLAGFLSSCAVTGTAEKSGGSAITIPIGASPWLPAFETVTEAYEKETGNSVNLLIFPQDQLFSKQLLAADAGSEEYDVYTVTLANVGLFYDGGFATPLREVDPGFEWPSGIIGYDNECRWDPAERFFASDADVMGLPINGNVNLEYYRRDLYDEMDLKGPPETWDDVIAAARKARKKYGGDVYGYLVRGERGANAASYDYMPLLSGFGGSIFADPPGDWSVVIDSEEALEATDKWLELATYGPPQPGVVTQGTMIGLMQSGQALHTHMTSAAALPLSDPTQTAVADKIDATVIPKPRNGEHATIAGGWLAVIPSHLEDSRKRLAYEFMDWVVRRDAQMRYAEAKGIVSHTGVYESDLVEEKGFGGLKVIAQSLPYVVRGGYDCAFGPEVGYVMDRRLNEIISGLLTPRRGHDLMAVEITRLAREAGFPA
jgi:multiple sugar transport system substrate-binding protein